MREAYIHIVCIERFFSQKKIRQSSDQTRPTT